MVTKTVKDQPYQLNVLKCLGVVFSHWETAKLHQEFLSLLLVKRTRGKKTREKGSWFEIRSCLTEGKEKRNTKAMQKQKEKTVILYFPSASDVQPQHGSRASVFVVVALEDPHFHIKSVCVCPILFPLLLAERDVIQYGISLWSD